MNVEEAMEYCIILNERGKRCRGFTSPTPPHRLRTTSGTMVKQKWQFKTSGPAVVLQDGWSSWVMQGYLQPVATKSADDRPVHVIADGDPPSGYLKQMEAMNARPACGA